MIISRSIHVAGNGIISFFLSTHILLLLCSGEEEMKALIRSCWKWKPLKRSCWNRICTWSQQACLHHIRVLWFFSSLIQLLHLNNGTDTRPATSEGDYEGHVTSVMGLSSSFSSSDSTSHFLEEDSKTARGKWFAKIANKGNSARQRPPRATLHLPMLIFPRERTHSPAIWAKLSLLFLRDSESAGSSVRKSSDLVSLPKETISLVS